MNILPLLYADFKATGEKPRLMVAAEYASLLDGVSYVDRVIHEGPHYELDIAAAKARELSKEVVVTQVNAPKIAVLEQSYRQVGQDSARTTSFQKEAWKLAGKLHLWNSCPPLVFDQRNHAREDILLRDYDLMRRGKQPPLMLLALKSNSSPFPYADLLRELVTLKFSNDYRIIELPQAERIYDLLAIYNKAALLISVDSAPLHLAWACRKLPVFALTQDRPSLWHGASWRPNHLWYCRYHDWPERAVTMCKAIQTLNITDRIGKPFEVVNSYDCDGPYSAHWRALTVHRGMCGRDSTNTLLDSKRNPYLKDVLRMAIQRTADDDAILLSRRQCNWSDVPTSPCYAYRMTRNGEGEQFYPICDLFCATRKWWREALPEIPDLVLGNDHFWSECLRVLFQSKGATNATGVCTYIKEKL